MSTAANTQSIKTFLRAFRKHPEHVGQTYCEHFVFAASFSMKLFATSLAALVHAIVPPLFETTSSRAITELHERMNHQIHDKV